MDDFLLGDDNENLSEHPSKKSSRKRSLLNPNSRKVSAGVDSDINNLLEDSRSKSS